MQGVQRDESHPTGHQHSSKFVLCMQGREDIVRLACIRQHAMTVVHGMPSLWHLQCHTIHAALLCLAAVYVAGSALHDQPFRALHGIVVASTVDAALLTRAYHTTLCKRKPL